MWINKDGKTHCNYSSGSHGRGDSCGYDNFFCGSKKCGNQIPKQTEGKTIIIFNGPPGTGKDELAKHFTSKFGALYRNGTKHMEHKHHLKAIALVITGVTEEEWDERYDNRELKEKPWDKCGNISQRQLYIKISEEWCKPLFNRSYFGDRSTQRIKESDAKYFFFSDGGFKNETIPMLAACDRMVIIRIHREGHTYEGDSRKYLYMEMPEQIEEYDLNNDGTLQDMYDKASDIMQLSGKDHLHLV
jgi:hypothetical protein